MTARPEVERPGDLAFVGDVHLEAGDPGLGEFLAFLDRVAAGAARIVFIGDLFDVWVGRPGFEGPHHARVVDHLARLRAAGTSTAYVEGNRDYRIASHLGTAFDDVSTDGRTERFGGHRIRAEHGDLAVAADLRYRSWRRLSRSRPFWAAVGLLPQRVRRRVASAAERRMRATNPAFKRAFPERDVRAYAEGFFEAGHDVVVLGHFHEQREIASDRGRIVVLPLWRDDPRWLRVAPDGAIGFAE